MPEIAEPEYIGEGKVWQTPSRSRPLVRHVTIRSTDGTWFCYCEGHRYTGKCWHVDTLREQEGDPTDSDEEEFHISL